MGVFDAEYQAINYACMGVGLTQNYQQSEKNARMELVSASPASFRRRAERNQ